jgi:hypothetical protein
MHHGGGLVGFGQPIAMAGGERWLGHEEVVRDPLEVGEGMAGAHLGLSMVVWLGGEKLVTGMGTSGRRWCRSGR